MIGNPHYEPNYEKYHYDPPWYDRVGDPETYHQFDQFGRQLARAAGPLLPGAAALLPAMGLAYNVYSHVEQQRAEARRRKRDREMSLQLTRPVATHRSAPGSPRMSSRQHLPPLMRDAPAEQSRVVELPPMPQLYVDIPPSIPKVRGFVGKKILNADAAEILRQAEQHGLDNVVKSLSDDNIHKIILSDIPARLLSPDYFPEPYLRLLTEETRQNYINAKKPITRTEEHRRREKLIGERAADKWLEDRPREKRKLEAETKAHLAGIAQVIAKKGRRAHTRPLGSLTSRKF